MPLVRIFLIFWIISILFLKLLKLNNKLLRLKEKFKRLDVMPLLRSIVLNHWEIKLKEAKLLSISWMKISKSKINMLKTFLMNLKSSTRLSKTMLSINKTLRKVFWINMILLEKSQLIFINEKKFWLKISKTNNTIGIKLALSRLFLGVKWAEIY